MHLLYIFFFENPLFLEGKATNVWSTGALDGNLFLWVYSTMHRGILSKFISVICYKKDSSTKLRRYNLTFGSWKQFSNWGKMAKNSAKVFKFSTKFFQKIRVSKCQITGWHKEKYPFSTLPCPERKFVRKKERTSAFFSLCRK